MATVVGYARVSTAEQAERGVSLDAQRAKIEAYCALHDLELVALEVDAGASGATMDRPGLQRALGALKRGAATTIVVTKMDRLTRSVADLSVLVERHFRGGKRALHSVTEHVDTSTAMGRGVLNIFASLGQMEREQIGERTATAMRHMRDEGRYTGGSAPYGFTLAQGALVPVEREQAAIAEARRLRAAGLTLRATAATLAEHHYLARSGRPFAPSAIASMTE